jgi:hypothetical protein
MTRRIAFPLAFPLVLSGLVLGLVLGSLGTAHAAGLTKGAVKKIAAKVVSKAAPKLSVAHAGSADSAGVAANADKLDNLDSSDLKTTTFAFTFVPTANAASKVYSLPGLPTGSYLASYTVITNTTNSVTCEIVPSLTTAPSTVTAQANSVNGDPGGSISGSAAVTTGAQPAFRCTSPSVATFDLASGSISFTRVDTLISTPAGTFS